MRRFRKPTGWVALGVLGAWAAFESPAWAAVSLSSGCEWKLSGGAGERIPLEGQLGKPGFRVSGQGTDWNAWVTDAPLEPGQLYRFDFFYIWRGEKPGGCVVAGPEGVNRDFSCEQSGELREVGFVFMASPRANERRFRLGQWQVKGVVDIGDPILTPVQAVHVHCGDLELGEGEEVAGHTYTFTSSLGGESSNFSRPIRGFTAGFNSNRWVLGQGQEVVYGHRLAGRHQTSGQIEVNACYVADGGRCVIEASKDGKEWRLLAACEKEGTVQATLPSEVFLATEILVRLRGDGGGVVQIDRYHYQAVIDGPAVGVRGGTQFVETTSLDASAVVRVDRLPAVRPSGSEEVRVSITNRGLGARSFRVSRVIRAAKQGEGGAVARQRALARLEEPAASSAAEGVSVDVPAGETREVSIPTVIAGGRRVAGRLDVVGEKPVFRGEWQVTVPVLYAADYGERLAGGDEVVQLWWSDATRKIARTRPVPEAQGKAVALWAARNEFEAAQLVVRPGSELRGLTASVSGLSGPEDARTGRPAVIAAGRIQVLWVYYHPVRVVLDAHGVADDWPDALPPLDRPLHVPAGVNQPLWILVRVPADASPGDYEGAVQLKAEGWSASVPIQLHVWDFALPEKPFTQSGFGLSMGDPFRYQGLKTDVDKRAVYAKYMQSFTDHRISPYDPTLFDRIDVQWEPKAQPPRAKVDFTRFDPAMAEAVAKNHITAFNLSIPGMGGGTFHERYEGEIAGFKAGSPEYEAMFSSMVKQLEQHLRDKGWLDLAYIYWFDEPDEKDYEFVRRGMERIHRYGPGLRRMLTEEPADALAGAVDLWCPLTPNLHPDMAGRRRAAGDHFWWYVCCGPRAPYCGLFIDHPATDLRVWLWQTWQHQVEGILIWSSTYWTSSAAFPDSLQNPYEDPMGYVSGYSTPKGTKLYWGNGDGRFLYPPLAAAGGSDKAVLDGPVSSIRWEMLREGVEDVDYLHILKNRLDAQPAGASSERIAEARRLLQVPREITASMTDYTFDSRPIYERRAMIAAMIERLGGGLAGK
ncbi:MAG: DUF4091 domain-containing protein [Phycisphaerae bacterium]|nr:DUF4091 domain-containing protein [Phycisphaerae bacterium]